VVKRITEIPIARTHAALIAQAMTIDNRDAPSLDVVAHLASLSGWPFAS
jgi:hypothetical protein